MSIANKYNKVALFTFSAPKDFEYETLHDLYVKNGKDFVYEIKAMYINKKSLFGESPVIATSDCFVNLPSHLTDVVKEMMKDNEVVNAVNEGHLGFQIYTYETEHRNGLYYSVNWVDC